MTDKNLKCRDCGSDFVFTTSEQEFFAQKGFTNEPARCPKCRAARKAASGSFGGGSSDRQMYPAVCAQCGKNTQVPFQPRSDRPVYCSDCFSAQRPSGGGYGGRTGGGGGGRDRRSSSGGSRDRGGW